MGALQGPVSAFSLHRLYRVYGPFYWYGYRPYWGP